MSRYINNITGGGGNNPYSYSQRQRSSGSGGYNAPRQQQQVKFYNDYLPFNADYTKGIQDFQNSIYDEALKQSLSNNFSYADKLHANNPFVDYHGNVTDKDQYMEYIKNNTSDSQYAGFDRDFKRMSADPTKKRGVLTRAFDALGALGHAVRNPIYKGIQASNRNREEYLDRKAVSDIRRLTYDEIIANHERMKEVTKKDMKEIGKGFTDGLGHLNVFQNDPNKYQKTFTTDLFDVAGWNKKEGVSKAFNEKRGATNEEFLGTLHNIIRGGVGFVGDIVTDPASYLDVGLSEIAKKGLRGTGHNVGYNADHIANIAKQHGVDYSQLTNYLDTIDKVKPVDVSFGIDNLNLPFFSKSLKNYQEANNIARGGKHLFNTQGLQELSDSTVSPTVNKILNKLGTSKLTSKLSPQTYQEAKAISEGSRGLRNLAENKAIKDNIFKHKFANVKNIRAFEREVDGILEKYGPNQSKNILDTIMTEGSDVYKDGINDFSKTNEGKKLLEQLKEVNNKANILKEEGLAKSSPLIRGFKDTPEVKSFKSANVKDIIKEYDDKLETFYKDVEKNSELLISRDNKLYIDNMQDRIQRSRLKKRSPEFGKLDTKALSGDLSPDKASLGDEAKKLYDVYTPKQKQQDAINKKLEIANEYLGNNAEIGMLNKRLRELELEAKYAPNSKRLQSSIKEVKKELNRYNTDAITTAMAIQRGEIKPKDIEAKIVQNTRDMTHRMVYDVNFRKSLVPKSIRNEADRNFIAKLQKGLKDYETGANYDRRNGNMPYKSAIESIKRIKGDGVKIDTLSMLNDVLKEMDTDEEKIKAINVVMFGDENYLNPLIQNAKLFRPDSTFKLDSVDLGAKGTLEKTNTQMKSLLTSIENAMKKSNNLHKANPKTAKEIMDEVPEFRRAIKELQIAYYTPENFDGTKELLHQYAKSKGVTYNTVKRTEKHVERSKSRLENMINFSKEQIKKEVKGDIDVDRLFDNLKGNTQENHIDAILNQSKIPEESKEYVKDYIKQIEYNKTSVNNAYLRASEARMAWNDVVHPIRKMSSEDRAKFLKKELKTPIELDDNNVVASSIIADTRKQSKFLMDEQTGKKGIERLSSDLYTDGTNFFDRVDGDVNKHLKGKGVMINEAGETVVTQAEMSEYYDMIYNQKPKSKTKEMNKPTPVKKLKEMVIPTQGVPVESFDSYDENNMKRFSERVQHNISRNNSGKNKLSLPLPTKESIAYAKEKQRTMYQRDPVLNSMLKRPIRSDNEIYNDIVDGIKEYRKDVERGFLPKSKGDTEKFFKDIFKDRISAGYRNDLIDTYENGSAEELFSKIHTIINDPKELEKYASEIKGDNFLKSALQRKNRSLGINHNISNADMMNDILSLKDSTIENLTNIKTDRPYNALKPLFTDDLAFKLRVGDVEFNEVNDFLYKHFIEADKRMSTSQLLRNNISQINKEAIDKFGIEILKGNPQEVFTSYAISSGNALYDDKIVKEIGSLSGKLKTVKDLNRGDVAYITGNDLRERLFDIQEGIKYGSIQKPTSTEKSIEKMIYEALGYKSDRPKVWGEILKINPSKIEELNYLGLQVQSMPENIYNTTKRVGVSQVAGDTNGLVKLYDRFLRTWKVSQTAINPGFHGRNTINNAFQTWMGAGAEVLKPSNQKEAMDIVNGKMGEVILSGGEILSYDEIRDVASSFGLYDSGYASDVLRGPLSKLKKGKGNTIKESIKDYDLMDVMSKYGNFIDNQSRTANFVHYLKQGMEPEQAVQQVEKFLFNYNDISDFERNVMRRIVPFYTYMRKNLPLQIEQLSKQPDKYRKVMYALEGVGNMVDKEDRIDRSYMPNYTKNWIETPFKVDNEDDREESIFIDPSLPHQTLSKLDALINPKQGKQEMLSMLSPAITLPYELKANKNVFFDEPIKRYEGHTKKISELIGIEEDPRYNHIFNKTGLPKNIDDYFRKKGSDRKLHALNHLVGIKGISYDNDMFTYYAMQRRLEEMRKKRGE